MEPLAAATALAAGVDAMNFGAGLYNQSYMREMQKKAWEREDTAVQRRVKDLKAAGLSPVLAAGSAAQSSAPIQVGTPQLNGANMMKAIEYAQAKKQMAVTDEQRRLLGWQADTAASDSQARQAQNRVTQEVYNGLYADKVGMNELRNSTADALVMEQKAKVRQAEDVIRNSDLRRKIDMPTDSTAADDFLTNTKILSNIKGGGEGNVIMSALLSLLGKIGGAAKGFR